MSATHCFDDESGFLLQIKKKCNVKRVVTNAIKFWLKLTSWANINWLKNKLRETKNGQVELVINIWKVNNVSASNWNDTDITTNHNKK